MMHLTPSMDKPETRKLAEPGLEKPEGQGQGRAEQGGKGEPGKDGEDSEEDDEEEEEEEESEMSGNHEPGCVPERWNPRVSHTWTDRRVFFLWLPSLFLFPLLP